MKTFPLIFQHDAMLCGVACLQMICKFYGQDFSAKFLSNICCATSEGVSLLSIHNAAQEIGLQALGLRASLNDLQQDVLPIIIHWNQDHFVVLYKIKVKKNGEAMYHVADPGKGLVTYTKEEFSKGWLSTINGESKGLLMTFETTEKFYTLHSDVDFIHGEKRSFRFLYEYIKRYKKYFTQILLGLFIVSIVQLVLPFLTQVIVDKGIVTKNLNFIYLVLIGQLVLTLSSAVVDFIRRQLLLFISMRINISLVSDFFVKLLKLPMAFFDVKQTGDLLQRMNDHKRVQDFLTNQTLTVAFSFFSFLAFSIVLLIYNWLIFVVFLLGSALYGGWMARFLQRRKVLDYMLFDKQAENNNKTFEFITSMQEIKLQDCENRRRWIWEDVQADTFVIQQKILSLQQAQEAGCVLINHIKNILITVLAATAVIHGNMSLGMMLAVQYIIGQLNAPVDNLMKFIYSLQDVKISLERINEIHSVKDEEEEKAKRSFFDKDKSLHLKHLDFSYDRHSLCKTLDDISIDIPEGKITAIVGTSGSGKTTLIKMLLGYYTALSGNLQLGDTELNEYNMKWWRNKCGVVMQNGVIFSESIARNIAVDDNEIDGERLLKAVEIACIKDFIESLPLKYSTKIGAEGVELSQGQKQRILIARAVYKNPDYIFLDEATNSLDANNERKIVENLNAFYRGKTVVIVAHRLSTVRNADNIVVISNGHLVETGNHHSLVERKGEYYNLVKNQLELGN